MAEMEEENRGAIKKLEDLKESNSGVN